MWWMTLASTRSIRPTRPMSSPPGPSIVATRNSCPSSPDRRLAVAVDPHHDVLVDLADEDHLRDLHRVRVADPQAADELHRHVEALHVGGDVRAAAVDDDRVQPDVLEQHHVT